MFWGITLENTKRYTQVVADDFHVSMAALEPRTGKGEGNKNYISIMLEREKSEFLLCTLHQDKKIQQALDLQFIQGEEITFFVTGEGVVHLTGYITTPIDFEDEEEDSEDEEDDEVALPGKKRKAIDYLTLSSKKSKFDGDSDDEDLIRAGGSDSDDDSDLSGDDSDDDLNSSSNSSPKKGKGGKPVAVTPNKGAQQQKGGQKQQQQSGQKQQQGGQKQQQGGKVQTPVAVKPQQQNAQSGKKQPQTPKAGQTPKPGQTPQQKPNELNGNKTGGETESAKKRKRNKKKKKSESGSENGSPVKAAMSPKEPQTPKPVQQALQTPKQTPKQQLQQTPKAKPQKLQGGVLVEDLKVGAGKEAKPGSVVNLFYVGRFQKNNKVFDSVKKGEIPFTFRLGKGEVIKGWDIGIQGMRTGGSRRIIIPSSQAYGSKGNEAIPANSDLVFEVQLEQIK